MDGSKIITATFTQNQYTLDVTTVGGGAVSKQPDQATYAHGTVVTMTATADTDWTFAGWSGDTSGNTNPLAVTMDGTKSITGTFVEKGVGEGASVQGTVVDENSTGIPNVQVTLSNEGRGALSAEAVAATLVFTETTDRDGKYLIRGVPAGTYTLTFAGQGYVSPEPVTVKVTEGKVKTMNPVVMQEDVGSADTSLYLPTVRTAPAVQASDESARHSALEKGLFLPVIAR